MPVYSRQYLRQTLGRNHLRDTFVSTLTLSWSQGAYSLNLVDSDVADLSLSGHNVYVGSWLWFTGAEVRVASFNAASGAYISTARAGGFPPTPNGAEYERHDALPPSDKNRALDEAIKMVRVRREVAIDSVADLAGYPLPAGVEQVLWGYVFATPTATLDRDRTPLRAVDTVVTATGVEVRVTPVLRGSQQLVLDAITTVTLGSADTATVNIPDERLVLYKAEALCWGLLARKAPRGTADEYRRLENAAAQQYNQLARNFKPPVDRPPRLDGEAW